MWVLIWMQVTVGIPVEYYQLNSFDSRTVCEQYREDAEVLVAKTLQSTLVKKKVRAK